MPQQTVDTILDHPSVRWVLHAGLGRGGLRNVPNGRATLTNGGRVLSEIVAEYTVSAIHMVNAGFPRLAAQQRRREWMPHAWTTLAGKTVSVIGLGPVGRAVARRARELGMTVIGMRERDLPAPEVDLLLPAERLCNAMARADFVSLHIPETPKTVGLIDKSAFACMGRGTVLLNLSPSTVVDHEGLMQALENGKIDCAVLDLPEDDPLPPDHPYWRHDKVVLSPGSASFAPDWRRRMFDDFLENLDRFRLGLPLADVVEPVRG